jgi:hypothetical protein
MPTKKITIKQKTSANEYTELHPKTIIPQVEGLSTQLSNIESEIDTKVNNDIVGQPNGLATLAADGKIPLNELPNAVFDSLYFFTTLGTGTHYLGTLFQNAVSDATLKNRNPIGYYWLATNTCTLAPSTIGYLGGNANVSATPEEASSNLNDTNNDGNVVLEKGDWVILSAIKPETNIPNISTSITFAIVNNTYEDATAGIKGIVSLSSATATNVISNDVITNQVLNGLMGMEPGKIAPGSHNHDTTYLKIEDSFSYFLQNTGGTLENSGDSTPLLTITGGGAFQEAAPLVVNRKEIYSGEPTLTKVADFKFDGDTVAQISGAGNINVAEKIGFSNGLNTYSLINRISKDTNDNFTFGWGEADVNSNDNLTVGPIGSLSSSNDNIIIGKTDGPGSFSTDIFTNINKNIIIGNLAGSGLNANSNENLFIGYSAGRSAVNGSKNVFIGSNSGFSENQKNNAINSVAIGNNAYTTKDKQMVFGEGITEYLFNRIDSPFEASYAYFQHLKADRTLEVTTSVGIGTVPATQKLDVNGDTRLRGQLFDSTNSTGSEGQLLSRGANGVQWSSVTIPGKGDLTWTYVYGKVQVAITKGQALQFAGVQGDHILLKPAVPSEINANPDYFVGLAEADALANDFIYVVDKGEVRDVATNAYPSGTILWYQSEGTTAGLLRATEPSGNLAKIQVGAVTKSNATEGIILVRVNFFGVDIEDIKAVGTPTENTYLRGDGTWGIPSGTSTGTVATAGTINTNTLPYWVSSTELGSLDTATYPSLTEVSYVKGVTSGIQSQLDAKATPSDISTAISNLINSAPGALDTLDELAAALGDDANFASTVTNALAGKADISHTHDASHVISGIFSPSRLGSGTPTELTFLRGDGAWASPSSEGFIVGSGVENQLTYWNGTSSIAALSTDTYPSLTELSFVKGTTSSVQTQLNNKSNVGHPHTKSDITDFAHTHAASDITSGIIATARLGTGTANSTTYLRGDGTWQIVEGGSDADTVDGIHGTSFVRNDIYNSANAGFQVFRNIGSGTGSWQDGTHTFSLENSDAGNIAINLHRAGYSNHNILYNGSTLNFDLPLLVSGSTVIHSGTIGSQSVNFSNNTEASNRSIVFDVRDTNKTPAQYNSHRGIFEFNNFGIGSSTWWGVMTVKGWDGAYAAWQLAGPASIGQNKDDLYFRGGQESTWGSWHRIWHSGNITPATAKTRTDWNDNTVINNVVGQLAWKNYGNGHTIFDASAGTTPSGTIIIGSDAQEGWYPGSLFPYLMGWNGVSTYGVRVDSARLADSAGSSNTANYATSAGSSNTANYATSAGNLNGYNWDSSGKNVRGSEIYVDGWFRNYNANTGLYNQTTTQHWYSTGNGTWKAESTTTTNQIQLATSGNSLRGSIHVDNSNNIGFRNNIGTDTFRINASGDVIAGGSRLLGAVAVGQNTNASFTLPTGCRAIEVQMQQNSTTESNTIQRFYLTTASTFSLGSTQRNARVTWFDGSFARTMTIFYTLSGSNFTIQHNFNFTVGYRIYAHF